MRRDQSVFRNNDILDVYGPERICFQTACRPTDLQPVDPHHIMGKGGQDDPMFSSIFNLAWLRRDIHKGPLRDAKDQRAVYLRVARQHVFNAVGRGTYTLKPEDEAFLAHAEQYLKGE